MLLTITTTAPPESGYLATDLGYLLHKHPDNLRTVNLPFGTAQVFFPEATEERCAAALLVDVDPIGLTRRKGQSRGDGPSSLSGYVNDRPYAASSMLSVALAKLFGTAMSGTCDSRPDLAASELRCEVQIPVLRCRGGRDLLNGLFEPLGYEVTAAEAPLDDRFPEWGPSPYLSVTLAGKVRLADLLSHLYVLIPVLDDHKHYWVDDDEAQKLLDKGGAWLAGHPAKELITNRYLKRQRSLTEGVLSQLNDDPMSGESETTAVAPRPPRLAQRRRDTVIEALRNAGAAQILDLGCGEGHLINALLAESWVDHVTGADVSTRALDRAAKRLHIDTMTERQAQRVTLIQAGATYRDARFAGHDAVVLMEVIEHVDEDRLWTLEQVVFVNARPNTVVVTTPNADHNVRFPALTAGAIRHHDHRFEWTRAQFVEWTERVAEAHGYTAAFHPIGDDDPEVGPPTQMAVFGR